jgi:hypothetical protein
VSSGLTARTARPSSRPIQVAAGAAAALAADVAFDPAQRHVPLCPFHAITGWQCPLCGGLRCVDALVHGQWSAALHDNALLVAALPVLVWLWVDAWRRSRTGRPQRSLRRRGIVAVVVVLAAFTIARNVGPMAALRP